MKRCIIIGSGIAGIASSIRMARKGYVVDVYEANNYAGGKLTWFEQDGYTFDAGPSLFTLPWLVTELFELCGEDHNKHFSYSRRSTLCHYFWEDGSRYDMPMSPEAVASSMAEQFGVEEAQVLKYLRRSQHKYDSTNPVFIERSLHKVASYTNKETLSAVAAIPQLDLFSSLDAVNRSYFRDERLVQLFNRYATYNGSSPYQTSGIMSMIPHLEIGLGTYFPDGGMRAITDSLVALAQRQGVTFHFNQKVNEIILNNRIATGIRVNGGTKHADIVISNMDVFATYKHLLPENLAPQKILNQERSSSALIFYWGIKKSFDQLDLHNILFSSDYKGEFEKIYKDRTITDDPTVYINISSKGCMSDAPLGCENWFVMINTPGNFGQNWALLIEQAKVNIVSKINRILGVDILPLIQTEAILDPRSIESRTQSHRGALYGTSSNSMSSAFLRHPNFSASIKNLYFCGGSVHPGGGIPLCLNSAKIVANLIQ